MPFPERRESRGNRVPKSVTSRPRCAGAARGQIGQIRVRSARPFASPCPRSSLPGRPHQLRRGAGGSPPHLELRGIFFFDCGFREGSPAGDMERLLPLCSSVCCICVWPAGVVSGVAGHAALAVPGRWPLTSPREERGGASGVGGPLAANMRQPECGSRGFRQARERGGRGARQRRAFRPTSSALPIVGHRGRLIPHLLAHAMRASFPVIRGCESSAQGSELEGGAIAYVGKLGLGGPRPTKNKT